jgi:tRNA A37 threonylcarbamoyladenosine biosynthesis protein TsaE
VRVKKSKEIALIGFGMNKYLDNDSVSLVEWQDIGSLELAYESNDFEISINLDDIYLPDSNNMWLSISYDW